ncbi:MAG: DHA2 family efflux MFS transporter permease subunit [Actinomycetota bacterium]
MVPRMQDVEAKAYERRWWILGVLCLSLFIIVLDNSILNVALPTIVLDLDATNSQLQWMVDAYTLVFAGLLLTAGALGDRFGRRGALQVGFVIFGLGSVLSALASTPNQLIATRAFMGIGGAFIMPATLSIITNVFPPQERGRAIGMWAGVAGLAILGPLVGGFLLEHYYWGSIFWVNIPIVVFGLVAGAFLIPTSKDPAARPLDPVGALLSISGLTVLIYGIIEAPQQGWTEGRTLVAFAIGAVLIALFFAWEARTEYPMLDLGFFRNPRFTVASSAIAFIFFAMFGSIFLFTQYFQFVLGYSALETGVRLMPWAVTMMILAPNSPRLVERVGTKAVVSSGLALMGVGLITMAGVSASSPYPDIVWRMVLMAAGMGLTMAPATESIMGSLPLAKAGVGSAVNDTTRQVGGALGVAVIGSVASSLYASHVADAVPAAAPPGATAQIKEQIGAALAIAEQLGVPELATAARTAFVDGMHAGVLVAAGAALLGALFTALWLPARARESGPDAAATDQAKPSKAAVSS